MLRKYIQKIQQMPESAKASFWFVVSNVALKGISFITTPIFTRLLEVADYGTTSVFVTWEGVISIFATLNLAGGVYNVAMAKYADDIDAYTSSMFVLETLLSAFVYSLVIAFNAVFPQVLKLSQLFLLYMWVQTLTNAFATFWLMRLRYQFKYKPVIAFTFANSLLSPCVAIAAIRLFPQNMAMAKVFGAGLFGIVFGLVIAVMVLRRGKRLVSWLYWRSALRFNIPLLPHYLSGTLLGGADKLMIDGMVSRAAAGIYGISNSIAGVLALITGGINSILIPVTLQSIKNQNYVGLKKTIVNYLLIISTFCIFVMMFGREAVLLLASEKYLAAIPFVPPLILAGFLNFSSGIVGNIQFYYEKTWQMSFSTICSAILNIIMNYFGIKFFGAIAAAYTTLLTSLLSLVLYYYFASKNEKNMKEILDMPKLGAIFCGLGVYAVIAIVFEQVFLVRLLFAGVPAAIAIVKRKELLALLKKQDMNTEAQE